MRRSTISSATANANAAQHRDRSRGGTSRLGGNNKPGILRNESNDGSTTTQSFHYTVLYYKRKNNKVHKSKGVSKLDGRLAFRRYESSSTKPNFATLFSEDGTMVYQGGMRGTTGEFHPDETISFGAFDVEILSLLDNKEDPSAYKDPCSSEHSVTGHPKSFPRSASLLLRNNNKNPLGKSLGLGGRRKQVRKGGLGSGKRPLAAAGSLTRKPAVPQPPQKTARIDPLENSENETVRNPPPKRAAAAAGSSLKPLVVASVASRRNSKTILVPGLQQRTLSRTKAPSSSSLGFSLSRPAECFPKKLGLSSNPHRTTGTTRNDTTESQNFFPGAVGAPMVSHSIRKVLRPHQIEGVVFLWNCLTGNGQAGSISPHYIHSENGSDETIDESGMGGRLPSPKGCILCDEMGLGKTLMTIATISALHRRNRTNRFVVVCPASLVNNWAQEFDKWLGKVGLPKRVVIKKGGEEGIRQFKTFCAIKPSNTSEVLIVSYDLFRRKSEILQKMQKVGLLVVDEGHRLKNTKGSHTMTALESLPCDARLCITATPIQNNLGDMFTIVNFVCPGVLGDIATFRRVYERPITLISNKRKTCTPDQIRNGEESRRTLDKILQSLMLRRLQKDVLNKLLPPRHVFLLFCRPTLQQRKLYQRISKFHCSNGKANNNESCPEVLAALTKLRKICAHPKLVEPPQTNENGTGAPAIGRFDCEGSGKLMVLRNLVVQMREKAPTDKVVIVSNFTSTLTVIEEAILKQLELNFLRLDGSINSADRQSLVDTFNRTSAGTYFALMLSSKAGGVGLNLIGANRLIMVDPDWNPSTDVQAMARIYREGQKKSCFIYRCFTSGTLEEVILQRQMQKDSLATMTMDRAQKSSKTSQGLNANELSDCFTLKDERCTCDTRQKVANWPDYDGNKSLVSQGCQDKLLMEVAAKEDTNYSMLSFVHIVKDDDKTTIKVGDQATHDRNSESERDNDSDRKEDYENESSDEEFEFE